MSACISIVGYMAVGVLQATSIIVKATVDSAIQLAIALWERNSSQSIANMQNELADRQTKLAEKIQAHAILFWPKETQLVNDVFGEGKAVTGYHGLASGWGQMADIETDAGRSAWIRDMDTRCTPVHPCEDARWQRNAQLVRGDLMSYAARQDEARTQIINDRRYARQLAIIGLGKGQLQKLMSYQDVAMTIGINASEALMSSVNTGLTAFGYHSNRLGVDRWGSGIQETWTKTGSIADRPAQARSASGPVAQPSLSQMNPVSTEMLKAEPKVLSKSNEDRDLESDLYKMSLRGGSNY